MLHVKTDEIYGKNPIVNVQDLRTHIINIDSRMRKSHMEPPTDFQYDLAHVYKNVIRARVASVEIPGVFYNFSLKKKNESLLFWVITLRNGNVILNKFNMYGIFFRITLDERTQKVTIHHDGSALPPCPQTPTHCPVSFGLMFGMVGQEERIYDFGLGFNLGFVKQIYVVDTPAITSESVIQTMGDAYFLLAIDDMYTVEHSGTEG